MTAVIGLTGCGVKPFLPTCEQTMNTSAATWSEADTTRACQIWADYQREHDLTERVGQAVGIDPVSGRVQ